jgi:general stress protein 26
MTTEDTDRVWTMIEDLKFCMLATWDGTRLHARPMQAVAQRDEGAIYFFTDVNAQKDDEISRHSRVCLAFGDPGEQNYVSVSGQASVTNDRSKIKELWSPMFGAWWENAEDPNIRLIKVVPYDAEYWDSPGGMVSALKIAFAAATGNQKPEVGDHAKVAL